MATAYIVAATPSSPEPKRISNLKSAKVEADTRAKLDRVDVEVRTVATGKLTYTAQGAPTLTPAPAAQADAPAADDAPQEATPEPTAAPAEDSDAVPADEPTIDMSGFEAALAEVVSESDEDGDAAPADDDAEEGSQDDEGDTPAAPAQEDHRGQAECGCSVEKIIATGEHGKGCADAPKAQAAAKAVERDKPTRPARTGGGTRREALGASAVDGWELLYDKPKQKAQVGRNSDGKYALICTTHKHAHPLTRLVQERGLRGGKRSVWCPQCTD
jgi:hypothetical protein